MYPRIRRLGGVRPHAALGTGRILCKERETGYAEGTQMSLRTLLSLSERQSSGPCPATVPRADSSCVASGRAAQKKEDASLRGVIIRGDDQSRDEKREKCWTAPLGTL